MVVWRGFQQQDDCDRWMDRKKKQQTNKTTAGGRQQQVVL